MDGVPIYSKLLDISIKYVTLAVMKIVINFLVQGIAVFVSSLIVPGVMVESYATAILVAVLLAVVNTLVKPILFLLTLPLTILTLGLFTFVLNAVMILIVDALIAGFEVQGIISALLFSLVLSLVNGVLNSVTK